MNTFRCASAFVCLFLMSSGAFAQANPQQSAAKPQPVTAQEAQAVLASARQSVAAAQPQEAINQLNSLLARDPVNRDAVQLKTSILLDGQRFDQALAVYDSYVAALRKPDAGVLALVARAELKRLLRQQQSEPMFVAAALERLARDGDAAALQDLKQAAARTSPESPEGVAALSGLVKLGDKDAIDRLGSLLGSASSMETRVHLIQVVRETGARTLGPSVAALLGDPSPQIRAAAALAVAVLQVKESVPKLQALLQDEVPLVRIYAAIALKRLGQPSADTSVAGLLKSEVPEARLMAAEAYQTSKSTEWIPAIKSLLGDRNEMTRLRAAELLACCDQTSARTALVGALDGPNQLIRNEAARILEAKGLADPTVARRLLGDPFEGVRLYGAGATLLAAAVPAR